MLAYNELAAIYDAWSEADPASGPCREFYLNFTKNLRGNIVEFGVGTGRIALALAQTGREITGVDISTAMLESCREKARAMGLEDKLHLIQADFCRLNLPAPVELIYLPFRTIGHFTTHNARLSLFSSVRHNLAEHGLFVFDHYVFSESWARANDRKARFMCTMPGPNSTLKYIYDLYAYDYVNKLMDCHVIIEDADASGLVMRKSYVRFDFSWFPHAYIRELAQCTGFVVDNLFGDFSGRGFSENSPDQIWVLRKA